jgi:hypothetical protein
MAKTRHEERIDTIIVTLRSLRDVGETLQRGDAGGRFEPGSKMLTMPQAWHAGCPKDCLTPDENGRIRCNSTYAQLLANLTRLERMGPNHYWHLRERYLVSEIINRDLINRGGVYFEAIARPSGFDAAGEIVRYEPGAPVRTWARGGNQEVVKAVARPRVPVIRKPGDPRMVLVRAIVERWDARVERRPVTLALDVLSSFMPRRIVLPRDVLAAA